MTLENCYPSENTREKSHDLVQKYRPNFEIKIILEQSVIRMRRPRKESKISRLEFITSHVTRRRGKRSRREGSGKFPECN